ncbi:MAG: serine hydrolase [Planctomycetes bacterium]|nr:serine hydrolase [Planctomycetota bacterium]
MKLLPIASLTITCVAPAQVVSYHAVTSASHQAQFTQLSGQGYRLTSLAVSGGLSAPRYTAVWRSSRAGAAWVATHDQSSAGYSAWRTAQIAAGYRPEIITAAGNGADTVFAAVFVRDGATVRHDHDYSQVQFATAVEAAHDDGYIPVSIDVHGTATLPLYSCVFEPNTFGTGWGVQIDATHAEWVETYDGHTEAEHRLACVGMSEHQSYISAWHDDRMGLLAVRSNYTTAGFDTQVSSLGNAGYDLYCVAAGGTGAALRHAGGFATLSGIQGRTLTTTGAANPTFAVIDTYMRSHIQAEGVRAASIAITKDGRLVYARGYTWAESGYPITQPTSNFRIASLAKVPTAVAIHKLMEQQPGALSYSSRPATLLSIPADPTGDANFPFVTVQQCLEYRAGLPRNYSPATIADWYYGRLSLPTILPAARSMGERWLASEDLLFTPGQYCNYSNPGHFLLGQVVEQIAGTSTQNYLHTNIYAPLGITRPRVAGSLRSQLVTGEILSHERRLELEPSELHTDRRRLAPQYAADLAFKNASGGTVFSTVDYVRMLTGLFDLGSNSPVVTTATRNLMLQRRNYTPYPIGNDGLSDVTPLSMSWNLRGNGVHAYQKGGSLGSASTNCVWRSDGIAFAVFFNRGSAGADLDGINMVLDGITSWPNGDLFPSYGLPTFPLAPEVTAISPGSLGNVGNTPFVVTGRWLDTVTSVSFGSRTITSQSPTQWQNGYFVRIDPSTLEVHPPQNLQPGLFTMRLHNSNGASAAELLSLTANVGFVLAAPESVNNGQNFAVIASRGMMTPSALAVFAFSYSQSPSIAPGIVALGIGAQFSDLIVSSSVGFDATKRTALLALPPLPPGAPIYAQTAAFDPGSINPLPLQTTNVRRITLQ